MNALDLMARLEGEILNNKIRAHIGGEILILARLVGTEWEYTEKGQELANLHSNLVVEEAAAPKAAPKARTKPATAVESADAPAETPAEEQAPTAE